EGKGHEVELAVLDRHSVRVGGRIAIHVLHDIDLGSGKRAGRYLDLEVPHRAEVHVQAAAIIGTQIAAREKILELSAHEVVDAHPRIGYFGSQGGFVPATNANHLVEGSQRVVLADAHVVRGPERDDIVDVTALGPDVQIQWLAAKLPPDAVVDR